MDPVHYIRRGRPEGRPAVNPVNPIVPKGIPPVAVRFVGAIL